MTTPDDYLEYSNAPDPVDIERLTQRQHDALGEAGRTYMAQRFAGKGEDVGSIYAYIRSRSRTNRDDICRAFGWPNGRPIIAIYASKWFDTPHAYGMKNFRDFLDWTQLTLGAAKERTDVSWLIKPHPIDDWYGGIKLRDLIDPEIADHICIADDSWHGKDVMDAVDALITTHGTAGVEYSFAGKPVLCADQGWYSRHEFVTAAPSRDAYLALLGDSWWQDHDLARGADAAALFSGLFYGVPAWQEGLIMPDDLLQDEVCDVIAPLISGNTEAMETELATIRDWYDSGRAAYHPFKMLATETYGDIISSRRIEKRYNPDGR